MMYTHNLKIILVDKQNNIITNTNTDDSFLASVKAKFTKNIIHPIEWNGKMENISVQWFQNPLNDVQKYFMGDLFACPIYEMDSILVKHCEKTIASCITDNKEYSIRFHISRIIRDKQICLDTGGCVGFNGR